MYRHLTVVLPQLALVEAPTSSLPLPNLYQLLQQGGLKEAPTLSLSEYYFTCFAVDSRAGELPIAAVTALGEGQSGSYPWWLCADPVSLQADHSTVYLRGVPTLTEAENSALLALLNGFLAEDNHQLIGNHSGAWYLNLAEDPELRTPDPGVMTGHSIANYLTDGSHAPKWRRLFTELQLLLHDCAVNQTRRQQGQATIDGLWFWGGGCLPRLGQPSLQAVWGNDNLLKGLAQLGQVPMFPPHSLAECLSRMERPGYYLLILDGVPADEWFASLLIALKAKKLSTLDLYFGNNRVYHKGKSRPWWPWKKMTQHQVAVLA